MTQIPEWLKAVAFFLTFAGFILGIIANVRGDDFLKRIKHLEKKVGIWHF